MRRIKPHKSGQLDNTPHFPELPRTAGFLLWRGTLLGTALYLLLGDNPTTNLKLNGASFFVAGLWSYYDGLYSKRTWVMASLEATMLHLLTVQVGNLLTVLFGHPLVGP